MWQIINKYIGVLILGIGEIIFARIVLNQRIEIKKTKAIVIFLISTILCAIGYIYLQDVVKTSVMFIVHMIEFKLLFNLTYLKSLFLTVIYSIVLLIPDFINLLIITKVLGMDIEQCYNEFAGSFLSNTLTCILFILVTIILKKALRKIVNTEISNNAKIVILSIMALVCIGMFFYNFNKELKISGNAIPYLMVVIIITYILFSLIKQTIENSKLIHKYDKLLEFMKTYEAEIEKQRTLRHETKNSFLAIKAKIQDKQENKDIINYIDEILKEKIEVKQEMYAKFGYLPPNGIKGLCYFKVQEAENKGIKISLNISKKVVDSAIYDLNIREEQEFGKILGVFLDNAIEASLESEEKQLGIEVYTNKEKEFKMIISNTYKNDIDKNKLGKERTSTKGKDRGHGLLLVKHIVNRNEKFKIETEITEKIYIQRLIVIKEKEKKNDNH